MSTEQLTKQDLLDYQKTQNIRSNNYLRRKNERLTRTYVATINNPIDHFCIDCSAGEGCR